MTPLEAIEADLKGQTRLVLLDIRMPNLDGVSSEQDHHSRRPEVKVLYILIKL